MEPERKKLVLEQVSVGLKMLCEQAAAIDETLLAHLIDTSWHEADNALERLRWDAENKDVIKNSPSKR
jgi:hypothetical protein